jgi:hypothetical protein
MRKQQAGDQKRILGTAPIQQLMPLQSYRVELPQDLLDEQGQLLDWVIGYAFDTLEAHHLDLRIVSLGDRRQETGDRGDALACNL